MRTHCNLAEKELKKTLMSNFLPQKCYRQAITTKYLTDIFEFAERLLSRNKLAYSGFPDQLKLKFRGDTRFI